MAAPRIDIMQIAQGSAGVLIAIIGIGLTDQLCTVDVLVDNPGSLPAGSDVMKSEKCIDFEQSVLETLPLGYAIVLLAGFISERFRRSWAKKKEPKPAEPKTLGPDPTA